MFASLLDARWRLYWHSCWLWHLKTWDQLAQRRIWAVDKYKETSCSKDNKQMTYENLLFSVGYWWTKELYNSERKFVWNSNNLRKPLKTLAKELRKKHMLKRLDTSKPTWIKMRIRQVLGHEVIHRQLPPSLRRTSLAFAFLISGRQICFPRQDMTSVECLSAENTAPVRCTNCA